MCVGEKVRETNENLGDSEHSQNLSTTLLSTDFPFSDFGFDGPTDL